MIIPVLVIIALALAIWGWNHFEHRMRNLKTVFFILFLLLIAFSVFKVFYLDKPDLSSPRGIINGIYLYFGWLKDTGLAIFDIGKNGVVAVGNVVKGNYSG